MTMLVVIVVVIVVAVASVILRQSYYLPQAGQDPIM